MPLPIPSAATALAYEPDAARKKAAEVAQLQIEPRSAESPISIPHHLQDKDGFCGAACLMMLLEDAFPELLLDVSQNSLMRRIKAIRTAFVDFDIKRKTKKDPPSETLYAWHASPRELAAVMNEHCFQKSEFSSYHLNGDHLEAWANNKEADALNPLLLHTEEGTGAWKAVGLTKWDGKAEDEDSVKAAIRHAMNCGRGFMALIWDQKLGVRHPHWVVVDCYNPTTNSYLVADPASAGRPDKDLRYETIPHYTARHHHDGPYHCPCLVWRDSQHNLHAAAKHWVPEEKFEELLDEAAARSGGLRYLVIRTSLGQRAKSVEALGEALEPASPEKSLEQILRSEDQVAKVRLVANAIREAGIDLAHIQAALKAPDHA